jgi:hypothetical protein
MMIIIAIIFAVLFLVSIVFVGEAYTMLLKIMFLFGFYVFAVGGTIYLVFGGR